MVVPSSPHLKPFPSSALHVFPIMNNSPSSSSSSSSSTSSATVASIMNLKTLIHSLVFSHICRLARALSKAKSVLLEMLKDIELIDYLIHLHHNPLTLSKRRHSKNKSRVKLFGSFRLHYNWCSSHVMPLAGEPTNGFYSNQFYYDPSWNSVIPTEQCQNNNSNNNSSSTGVEVEPSGLSGYLHWLEEENKNKSKNAAAGADAKEKNQRGEGDMKNDIDELADMFIASCHEKFRLEKQESYRRFQEMMARSM